MLIPDPIIPATALVSAVGSAISAFIAYRVQRGADRAERNRRKGEINRLASQVREGKHDIDDLSDDLIGWTHSLFKKGGSGNSSMHEYSMKEIEEKKEQATSAFDQAEALIANLKKEGDRKIDEYIPKMEHHHIRMRRLQDWFSRRLSMTQESYRNLS